MFGLFARPEPVPLDAIAEPAVEPVVLFIAGAVIAAAIITVIVVLIVRKPKQRR